MVDTTVGTTRRREATRQRLLDAAAKVFAEVGLDAASVEAVCEAAGYTRGAFYSNFASKEELFLQLCSRTAVAQVAAVRAVVADLDGADSATGDDRDTFALVRRVLEASTDDRAAVLLMGEVRANALRNPSVAAPYRRLGAQLQAEVALILREIADAEKLALRIPDLAAAELFVTVWTSAAEAAAMDGLDGPELRERIGQALVAVAELVITDEAPGR